MQFYILDVSSQSYMSCVSFLMTELLNITVIINVVLMRYDKLLFR